MLPPPPTLPICRRTLCQGYSKINRKQCQTYHCILISEIDHNHEKNVLSYLIRTSIYSILDIFRNVSQREALIALAYSPQGGRPIYM